MKEYNLRWFGEISTAGILSLLASLVVVIIWIITRFFVLTDMLALCLAIAALSFVRLPNLKIAAVILPLFFIYDIFWVFLSEYIFKKNVMVSVAVSLPSLPMMVAIPKVFGAGLTDYVALGVGDMVLPGLFLCFLYRYDHSNRTPFKQGYFLRAWIGYILGLIVTIIMVFVLNRAQPALLYLVPFTMIPTVFVAYRREELRKLWKGIDEDSLLHPPSVNDLDLESDQTDLARLSGDHSQSSLSPNETNANGKQEQRQEDTVWLLEK
jgi:signal peptide peptidase-like protein 2B